MLCQQIILKKLWIYILGQYSETDEYILNPEPEEMSEDPLEEPTLGTVNSTSNQQQSESAANNSEKGTKESANPSDDQTLSLAVEMAAVNQAILSLSGQNPINIKSERMDSIFS